MAGDVSSGLKLAEKDLLCRLFAAARKRKVWRDRGGSAGLRWRQGTGPKNEDKRGRTRMKKNEDEGGKHNIEELIK